MSRPRLGVSACLVGERTRYDGRDKLDRPLRDRLARWCELVPVCPEAEAGFGIPREPMRLEGDPARPDVRTVTTRRDCTRCLRTWCEQTAGTVDVEGFVLKARSPSCGLAVPVFDREGNALGSGPGLFAAALAARRPELPLADEEALHDPAACRAFVEKIMCRANRRGEHR